MSPKVHANPPTRSTVQAGGSLYDIAHASDATGADQFHRDQHPASISIPKIVHRCRTGYRLARERYRQRKQLLEMDDRQLKDIGITPEQAELEAGKPIWKA